MEDWQLEFEWLEVRHKVQAIMKQEALPDLNIILLLIGIQEYGMPKANFTKEEKQDLMHIAVCRLLSIDGYYEFEGRDGDGWPHWKILKPFTHKGQEEQENMLKEKVIQYFKNEVFV
ncbi:MAG: hypothetical protein IPL95_08045 [Saprospiraceae bacterium]|jgi:hypothetical protein|nr:hypothetical protein [Saprospiraceae bacterium]